MTSQRKLLIDLLAEAADDVDADHLFQLASAHDANISLPTIYRTLNTLEAAEVITAHYQSSDHERKVYRIKDEETPHEVFHFTCRRCGKVTAFQSEAIGKLKAELSMQLSAEVLTLCMCAGGLCADCREKSEQLKKRRCNAHSLSCGDTKRKSEDVVSRNSANLQTRSLAYS